MPIEVLMPALSPTMETGTLAKWMVKEGDKVAPGDVIAEIETDKATMEVEAVDEGTVGKILVDEGTENVPVNELIALLLADDEDKSALKGAEKPSDSKPAEAKTDEGKAEPAKAEAKAEAAETKEAPAKAEAPKSAPKTNGKDGDRVFASPLARRIAEQKGLDVGAISGSGPRGRVVQRDVEGAKAQPAAAKGGAKAPAAPAPGAMPDDQIKAFFEDGSYEERPHDGMRKTIARRLVQSKQTIPHYYLTIECELDALIALRRELNDAAPRDKEGDATYRISVNDFLIRAMALALQKVPMANATWTESARLLHKHSDVGVAVALPDGLITPLIRRAEEKTLSTISNEMKDLAARARDKKLKPNEYEGGTTAVSNLGMYGIRNFTAVINPPHATILAVGQSEEKAVVRKGRIVTATIMTVTLSCDHRVVDGALGAQLLGAFKSYVEKPLTMLA